MKTRKISKGSLILTLAVIAAALIIFSSAGCEKNADYYKNAGDANFLSNRFKEASENYTQAIKMNPKMGYAYFKRGQCFEKLGKKDLAMIDYKEANKLEPKSEHGKTAGRRYEELKQTK